jgi:hypothetical protein
MLNCCPPDPDEMAEAFVTGSLSDEEASRFAWHVAQCVPCRRIVGFNLRYIPAIKEASRAYAADHPSAKKLKTAGAAGN